MIRLSHLIRQTPRQSVFKSVIRETAAVCYSSTDCSNYNPHERLIGSREIVCHGMDGNASYVDSWAFPFPSIRYRECSPDIMALREKERGDWNKLSIEEKKCLYRASFRQTLAELEAPNSDWKSVVGSVLISISLSLWLYLWIQRYVSREWPKSFSTEHRIAQYYRQVEINNQPITGNYRPAGAELRVHPKNKKMLKQLQSAGA